VVGNHGTGVALAAPLPVYGPPVYAAPVMVQRPWGYGPPPGYYYRAPRRVVYGPPVVYGSPRGYYGPPAVAYVGPPRGYYGPPPVVVPAPYGYGHGYGHGHGWRR